MKIDFCSDLHVDAWLHETKLHDPKERMWLGEPYKSTFVHIDWEVYKNPDSRILVIAGDTANTMTTTASVLEVAAQSYEYVAVIDGNHDHYDSGVSVEKGGALLKQLTSHLPNVWHLDGETGLVVDDVAFLGVTGWYDWKCFEDRGISEIIARVTWKQYSNDSVYPKFDCGSPEFLAMVQAVNLAEQVKLANEDDAINHIVLTTHMSPRGDIMEWKTNNAVWNALTPSYVNSGLQSVLGQNTNKKISHWIYGHTHQRQMVQKDGIIYANNARGYPRENPPFTLTQIEVPAK